MIHVNNINYSYQKGEQVLSDLSFSIPENSIFGFLGRNGSGKTTMIRILLNLCSPQSGNVFINNQLVSTKSYAQFSSIGALIEEPSCYTQLTGRENLKLLADYYHVSDERIDEVLTLIRLYDVQHKKVKKYSLGMKQRLGIGQAILHDPQIVILDEPTNGLDPQGMLEIRELLRSLKQQGKTIFLSSHLLSEIEKVCDHVCIIEKGKKQFSGKVSELQEYISKNITYTIKCGDTKKAATLIKQECSIIPEIESAKELRINVDNNFDVSYIPKTLISNGIELYELSQIKNSLEELFIKITNK